MDISIRKAVPHEADQLSTIAMQAKAYWGYTAEQLAHWKPFLTIKPDDVETHQVWVATDNNQIVGFAAIEMIDEEANLEHLWVSPDAIGQGVGKRLFQHVAGIVPEFVFTSDPHADEFYKKMGAYEIGDYHSDYQNRVLTKFKYRQPT